MSRGAALMAALAACAATAAAAAPDAGAPPPDSRATADGEGERPTSPATYEAVVRAPDRLLDPWSAPADATVEVLAAPALAASGAHTLQDALARLRGAGLSDEQGNALQQELSIRGFGVGPVTGASQGLSVFLDGVRLNEPAVEEVNFELIPLEEVERVEIVHGPTAVFGRNTLGGAIHVVTRRGSPGPARAGAEVEAGSFEHQRVRAWALGGVGTFDGYLSAQESTERGWRAAGATRSARLFGKLGVRAGGTDLSLSYQLQGDRAEEPGALPEAMLEADRRQNYTPGDFFQPTLHLVTFNGRQELGAGVVLSSNAFLRLLRAEQFNANWLGADTLLLDDTTTAGGTVQLARGFRAGPVRSHASMGVEVTRSAVHVPVHHEPNARFQVDEGGAPLPRLASDVSDAQIALGAFGQGQVSVASGPLRGLGATAALRADVLWHDIVDRSPDDPGKATGRARYARLVPSAGVHWTRGSALAAWASYSEGFRAPAFLELTCADPAAPCVGLQSGVAPDTGFRRLAPVRARTVEAAARVAVAPWGSATLAAYRTDLRDDIFSVTVPGTTSVFFQNVGSTRRQGVELSASAERGALRADLTYGYQRATFEGDLALASPRTPGAAEQVGRGARIPLVPAHRLGLSVQVRPASWLALTTGASWVGSQYLRGDEANAERPLPAYGLVHAGAELRLGRWTATLGASNLLDTRHETSGGYAPDGRTPGQPVVRFLTPGPPRRLTAAVRWEL